MILDVYSHAVAVIHHGYPWFWPSVIALLGAVIGSFFACMVYRLPRGQVRATRYSFCPTCRHRLYVPDLVPILSWLWQRGRCRYCQHPISARYLWIESVAVGLGLAVWGSVGLSGWIWLVLPLVWGVYFALLLLFIRSA